MDAASRIDLPTACLLEGADFRETLAEAASIGGADLVLTSPPYDDARTYDNEVSWSFADYQALGDACFGALVPGGHALVVLDSPVREWRKGYGTERGFTPWRVMLDWAERVGFRVPDRLAYGRQGFPGKFPGRFRNDWEPLLWFQKPGAKGFFESSAVQEPAGEESVRHAPTRITVKVKDGEQARRRTSHTAPGGMKNRGTLWWYGSLGSGHEDQAAIDTRHPARFALPFAEDAVRCFAPPSGLVVDPFLGSGTSAVAALKHGRLFLGGDRFADKQGVSWARRALERIERTLPVAV